MNKPHLLLVLILFISGTLTINSCNQDKKQETNEEAREPDHQDSMDKAHDKTGEEAGHEHQHSNTDSAVDSDGSKAWSPSGNGVELIKSDFHFITGNVDNIKPEVIQGKSGNNVLELTADGTPAAFVFHQKYGNVGLAASISRLDFKGTLKLIHHARNMSDYEFVAITDGTMKLGRVKNGKEKVFDQNDFDTSNAGQMLLKVSAAGTHFKGYIGDETVTHGHGDQMENGFVGLMIEGSGKIQIGSIEVFPLEAE
ncbi:MAG: hypothetical protein RJQ09_06680 [Cyclobacteriaceae bacterium]